VARVAIEFADALSQLLRRHGVLVVRPAERFLIQVQAIVLARLRCSRIIARNNPHAGIVPLNRGAVTTKKQTLSPATEPVVGNRPFLDNCLSLLQDRDAGIGVFPSDEKSW